MERADRAPSNFHWVMNTNISYKELCAKDRQFRARVVEILQEASLYLRDQIPQFQKKTVTVGRASLTAFSANLEVGKVRKFLHIDGYMSFDKYTQLEIKEITNFFNARLEGFSRGIYLQVKYVHDNVATVKAYTEKDQISLIPPL